ncbi:hypothetical protein FSP39_011156, partial [Pinctada imbricata]
LFSAFPGCGNLITFTQFLFISIEGLIFTTKFFTVTPKIPLREYVTMVIYFFFVQVFQNYSLSFNISMPLQMIFRAGSMMSSIVLGRVIQKRKYSYAKYISVLLITVGIAASTIASSQHVKHIPRENDKPGDEDKFKDMMIWSIGILMLVAQLFLSAGLGIFQEKTYGKYGKHPKESLFYNHFLPLPGFVFLMSDIAKHAQVIITNCVFVLTTECTALEVTLIVTLRKFVSIVISIIHFQNPFTVLHWFGTVLVFIGTLIFTELISIPGLSADKKEKEKSN